MRREDDVIDSFTRPCISWQLPSVMRLAQCREMVLQRVAGHVRSKVGAVSQNLAARRAHL